MLVIFQKPAEKILPRRMYVRVYKCIKIEICVAFLNCGYVEIFIVETGLSCDCHIQK